mgnify:CR=1 FL=1
MSRIKIFISLSVLLLASLACNFVAPTESTPPPSSQQNILQSEADVPRISVEQALGAIESGAAIVLDVRSAQAYELSHIPQALSIPLATIEADPNSLPLEKDQWIITYCT